MRSTPSGIPIEWIENYPVQMIIGLLIIGVILVIVLKSVNWK